MYAALTELEQWLAAASNWLTGAALVISLPLAAYNALPWKKAIFVDVHQYEEEPDAEV